MDAELLYTKARQQIGSTPEERLRKARARTVARTLILARQIKDQAVTPELLARTVNL